MLKSYRVTSAFYAKQLYREPGQYGNFGQGDLLVALRIVGDQIEFCRQDKPRDEGGKLEYTITESDLSRHSEEV